jgi:hypothetical protein
VLVALPKKEEEEVALAEDATGPSVAASPLG